ncbi:hypothetical protein G9A89_019718 [Geosiphon pyriformis]|nr:hypothetical protein G9A89_019718 [Geosiphon pyriformis]
MVEMVTCGWYTYVLTILTKLKLLGVPIEHHIGFEQSVIANEYLVLSGFHD